MITGLGAAAGVVFMSQYSRTPMNTTIQTTYMPAVHLIMTTFNSAAACAIPDSWCRAVTGGGAEGPLRGELVGPALSLGLGSGNGLRVGLLMGRV